MPGLDGAQVTERIVGAGTRTRVLILTTYADDDAVLPALRAGAVGYLTKDVPARRFAGGNFPNCGINGVDDPAWEFEYAPFGVDSGLCIGIAATATAKEGVTLQPCGVSAKTVWIEDDNDSPATARTGYVPLINGSDTNFSHPFVLTYPGNGFPTDRPRPQLFVSNLTGFSQGRGLQIGSVDDTQLWGADEGVLR